MLDSVALLSASIECSKRLLPTVKYRGAGGGQRDTMKPVGKARGL